MKLTTKLVFIAALTILAACQKEPKPTPADPQNTDIVVDEECPRDDGKQCQ